MDVDTRRKELLKLSGLLELLVPVVESIGKLLAESNRN